MIDEDTARMCSTPEGIGATVTEIAVKKDPSGALLCSTPEGIGATVTRKTLAVRESTPGCSTPEGIGATVTEPTAPIRRIAARSAQRPKASERRSPLVNTDDDSPEGPCSTPEGIGATVTE